MNIDIFRSEIMGDVKKKGVDWVRRTYHKVVVTPPINNSFASLTLSATVLSPSAPSFFSGYIFSACNFAKIDYNLIPLFTSNILFSMHSKSTSDRIVSCSMSI